MEIDGAQLAGALRGKQVPLLLAYLLLNRTPARRARGADRRAVARARARLPGRGAAHAALAAALSARAATRSTGRDELILELPAPVWIDLEAAAIEVERARQALGRGDARSAWALAQVPLNIASRGLLPGAQASWLEPRRRELEDVRLQALEVIGRAGLSLGGTQLASVERAARSLIDSEPYRESGYVLLMEAYARRRATSPRGCACSSGCGRCCATSSGPAVARGDRRARAAAAPGIAAAQDGADGRERAAVGSICRRSCSMRGASAAGRARGASSMSSAQPLGSGPADPIRSSRLRRGAASCC